MIWRAREFEWDLSARVLLMGVVNVTPDSFSDGGDCLDPAAAVAKAWEFTRAGADILDVGAESSRPGADSVPAEEELRRLAPVVEALSRGRGLAISVDTAKSAVAEQALAWGASVVNDVSGLREDPRMAGVVARCHAGLILMHRRGNPRTMQSLARYDDLIGEIQKELDESIDRAFEAGISYEQIVIDPGIGFAKTRDQSLSVIKHLDLFQKFERPLLVGTSRKSFIGEITGKPPKERVFGTAAAVALCVERGAKVIRVHDVEAMKDVVEVTQAILNAS